VANKKNQCGHGFTIIEFSVVLLLFGLILGFCALSFQRIYALYQLNLYSRQLINDIRYIQQQSMVYTDDDDPDDPVDPKYIIKFWSVNLDDGNKYEIYRKIRDVYYEPIRYELIREVILPPNIELTFNTSHAFDGYGYYDDPVRVLEYNYGGEIGTQMGTVNLTETITGKGVGVVVHKVRIRLGALNETPS